MELALLPGFLPAFCILVLPHYITFYVLHQGVVTPIGAVVTAATGVKKRSRGQGLFLVLVKRSRTIFKLGNAVEIQQLVFSVCGQMVKALFAMRSSGQAT